MADGLGRHDPEDDGADAAEQAFEALRVEVAGLGRQLDQLAQQGEGGGAITPDYSPTLGAIAKELKAVSTRLDGIERHPALKMTPASYRAEIEAVARATATAASRPFVDSLHDAQIATRKLESLAGRVRDRQEQQRWLATVGGVGVLGGVLLWLLLIRVLPWGAGDWLAALPLGGGRWTAGQSLMREADPVTWDKMVRLYKACPQESTTELCEAALTVRTIPPAPAQAAPEGAKGRAVITAPSSSRGKAAGQGQYP